MRCEKDLLFSEGRHMDLGEQEGGMLRGAEGGDYVVSLSNV